MLGLIIPKLGRIVTPPDDLIIGSWPSLSTVVWDYTPSGKKYFDSAVLMKWNKRNLISNKTISFSTLIGIPVNKNENVSLIMKDKSIKKSSKTVYFDIGNNDLDYNGKVIIDKLFRRSNIVGVFIEGYSDYTGGENENLKLSKERIASVANYISKYTTIYTPKAYGSMKAKQKEDGNPLDRKVIVKIYYKPRTN